MLGVKRMPRPLSESRKPESRRKTSVCAGHAPATNRFTPGFPGQPCAPRERVASAARRVRVLVRAPVSGSGNLLDLAGRFFWRFLLFLFRLFGLTGLPLLLLVRHSFLLHKLRLAEILALMAVSAARASFSR